MAERQPIETTNLDRYGEEPLLWSRPRDILAAPPQEAGKQYRGSPYLGTVDPDGSPHATGVGAQWFDGDLYFSSGAGTRKARNLASNPACTISMSLEGIDLVFEGEAQRTTDQKVLEAIASLYQEGGWPAEAKEGALTAEYSAPSAGPPPWDLYRFTFHTVYGVATAEPSGATRWRFKA